MKIKYIISHLNHEKKNNPLFFYDHLFFFGIMKKNMIEYKSVTQVSYIRISSEE